MIKSFIKNTGCTRKSTPTAIYENRNKNIHTSYIFKSTFLSFQKNDDDLMFFFRIPIRGVFKITCVPCAALLPKI